MLASVTQNERFCQTSLIVEPMVAPSRKFLERILCKKLTADPLRRTLVSQRLGTVLAKLSDRARVRIRPRTRLTINTALLIEIQKPAYATNDTHLADRHLHRARHRREPRRDGRRFRNGQFRRVVSLGHKLLNWQL